MRNYFEFGPEIQEMSFVCFFICNSGGNFVNSSGSV